MGRLRGPTLAPRSAAAFAALDRDGRILGG